MNVQNSFKGIMLLLTLCVAINHVFAQQYNVAGTLKTKNGMVVAFASIVIKDSLNKVIAFKASDIHGAFVLSISKSAALGNLVLEINHLGFKKIQQSLAIGKTNYDIVMEEKAIDLDDVEVKSRPRISSIGDTLTYDVGAFAKNEDRSIGDVIKRLPGMEVNENGQIKFNGQNISNLYIDGDDLLDDKYAIGTKTIPYAMVKGVEVLQNHQPLKVLRNKEFSDKIAINLVIKEEAKLKLTGQAKLGTGLPKQYDGELNAILFNKKYKMLNVLKGNNIGNDLSSDFEGFNRTSFMTEMANSRPKTLLSSGTSGSPNLPKNRYYLNRSGTINANNLMNYKSGLQVKSNVKMLLDNNELSYNSQTELYLAGDTIRYSERQNMDNHPFIADVSLNARSNKETYFLNNTLAFVYSKETGYSSLHSNEMDMDQRLGHKVRDFSNNLEYVPELKNKNIVKLNWYLNYFNQPQTLFIEPGINAPVLNGGDLFESLIQFSETPTWFNRATLAYHLTKGVIRQVYQAGIVNEFQKLDSELRLHQLDGSQTSYQASHDNNLHWNKNQFFVNGSYDYKKGGFESVLSVPLTLQRIAYQDKSFNLDKSKAQLLFNPVLRVKYMTNVEDYLSFNYNFKNETGNINGVYRGAILSNYRSLNANNAALQEQHSHNLSLRYNFRRSISMLFMNAEAGYKKARANTIASNTVSNNISETVLLPLINDVSSFNANIGVSKFIFALGATADLKASWTTSRFNQVFNETLLPFNDISFAINQSVEARLLKSVSVSYMGSAIWIVSKPLFEAGANALLPRQIQNISQSMRISYSPYKNTFIRLNSSYQFSKQSQFQDVRCFFLDAHAGYKISRWRTDIELDLTNLANVISYETYSISANQFGYNQYRLRGRMAMLKVIFNL